MELYLARHGNTFLPGQPAVWVGSQNDLPLVPSGIAQAEALARGLLAANALPTAVYTGPLLRMKDYADIIIKQLNLPITRVVDERLNELDYGKWSGLTTQEVCEKFGQADFDRWEQHSEWPKAGEWGESVEMVEERLRSFTQDLRLRHGDDERILLVASNGCLRYFLALIPGQFQKQIAAKATKMATGSMSKLVCKDGEWKMEYWDKRFS